MRRLRSLTARLVLTVAALVTTVALVIGAATIVGTRSYLTDRLDQDVRASLDRVELIPDMEGDPSLDVGSSDGPPNDDDHGPGDDPGPHSRDRFDDRPGQGVDSLTVIWPDGEDAGSAVGDVIVQGDRGATTQQELSTEALDRLGELPADGRPRTVELPGFGTYRVAVADLVTGERVAAGLPTEDVDEVVTNLVALEAALVAIAALVAVGGGLVLVRRRLRPLREVAATAHAVSELPLARGDIAVTERVPDHLTDEDTEVGRVGAALNTLLAHVEASLSARHRSEQQVRQFVADASHELRTPLATIAGYAELARNHPEDQNALRTALAKVDEESVRMTALVEDLLLLARLDSGRPLENAPVDLTRLLVEAVADAQVLAPDHRWRLVLPDHAVETLGDEHRLHQVVTNLLTNARKYTPPGTTVTVTAHAGGFSVHDDGPGFPPELGDHAFERFVRGDTARNRQGGVGLGLSLVEAIVTAHGGHVTLTSRAGSTQIDVRLQPTLTSA